MDFLKLSDRELEASGSVKDNLQKSQIVISSMVQQLNDLSQNLEHLVKSQGMIVSKADKEVQTNITEEQKRLNQLETKISFLETIVSVHRSQVGQSKQDIKSSGNLRKRLLQTHRMQKLQKIYDEWDIE